MALKSVSTLAAGVVLAGLLGFWKASMAEEGGNKKPDDGFVSPRGYVCYRARTPIVIDGKLDDAAWQDAAWTEDFRDIEGGNKPKPRLRTRAKMLWDDEYLYIGAELEEPNVWGTLTRHDSVIFQDNDFEVFLDPDGDSHVYAELEMNALNTSWDLLLTKPYKDGGYAVDDWDIRGLKTAVHVDGTLNDPTDRDRGWTLEIRWPLQNVKQLTRQAVPPKSGDQWRINFSRVEWDVEVTDGKTVKIPKRPENNWVWSPQGVIDMHRPETWGYLQFSDARPGTDSYRADESQRARQLLHRIYYGQIEHRKKHGKWGASLAELGLTGLLLPELEGQPKLEITPTAFEASVKLRGGKRVTIREDSRIWAE